MVVLSVPWPAVVIGALATSGALFNACALIAGFPVQPVPAILGVWFGVLVGLVLGRKRSWFLLIFLRLGAICVALVSLVFLLPVPWSTDFAVLSSMYFIPRGNFYLLLAIFSLSFGRAGRWLRFDEDDLV